MTIARRGVVGLRLDRRVRPARMLTLESGAELAAVPPQPPRPPGTAGEATLSAIFPEARNPFAHPELLDQEGLEPWEVGEVWLIGGTSRREMRFLTAAQVEQRARLAATRPPDPEQ